MTRLIQQLIKRYVKSGKIYVLIDYNYILLFFEFRLNSNYNLTFLMKWEGQGKGLGADEV